MTWFISKPTIAASAVLMALSCGALVACTTSYEQKGGQTKPQSLAPDEQQNDNTAFLELAEIHAARILAASPEWATQLGIDETVAGVGFQSRLSDFSTAGKSKLYALNRELLDEVKEIDRSRLNGTAAVTYDVMYSSYDIAARQNAFGIGLPSIALANPPYAVDQLFGQHVAMPMFFTSQIPVKDKAQLAAYISRLEQFSQVMMDIGDLLEADAEIGVVPPRFVLKAISESARNFGSGSISEHPIVESIEEKIDALGDLSNDEKQTAKDQVRRTISDEINPAFQRFAQRVDALYLRSSDDAGVWRLPNGEALYQVALESYGAVGMTADEIHDLGLQDVSRIQGEMDELLRGLGYSEGTVGERMNLLASDPINLYPNNDVAKEGILKDLERYIEDIKPVMLDWFETSTSKPIVIKRVPTYQENSSGAAFYTPPALDGSQPGTFWINLKDTADWPKYTLKSLVYHEALPGHHFQTSVQQEIEDMPLIRNMIWFVDYGEGWALYTEELAHEMGMYENDPLGDLGRLRLELYRAARLVVDTGVHDKRWTRQRAIDWMVETTGETVPSIAREIDRYAVWPAQATSYKIGMIKFQRLREKAEQELGDRFDIRAFHNELLVAGPMPMGVLEARMDEWIEEQK